MKLKWPGIFVRESELSARIRNRFLRRDLSRARKFHVRACNGGSRLIGDRSSDASLQMLDGLIGERLLRRLRGGSRRCGWRRVLPRGNRQGKRGKKCSAQNKIPATPGCPSVLTRHCGCCLPASDCHGRSADETGPLFQIGMIRARGNGFPVILRAMALFSYLLIHQLSSTSDTASRGSANEISVAPPSALTQRGDSSNCSCPAAFSRSICSAVGFCGEPIASHAVYALL